MGAGDVRVLCRELDLQRNVLSAQLSAQAAAIQQERESLMCQRVNTDMLASLSEQVRGDGVTVQVVALSVVRSWWASSRKPCTQLVRPGRHARSAWD